MRTRTDRLLIFGGLLLVVISIGAALVGLGADGDQHPNDDRLVHCREALRIGADREADWAGLNRIRAETVLAVMLEEFDTKATLETEAEEVQAELDASRDELDAATKSCRGNG